MSFEHARRSVYEIIGTLGGITCHTVWQPDDEQALISYWTDSGVQETVALSAANHFNLEIEHFSDCVLNGKAPRLSLADARGNCAAISAALQSVREGRAVKLA
jgi:predicted dehydrogenase